MLIVIELRLAILHFTNKLKNQATDVQRFLIRVFQI